MVRTLLFFTALLFLFPFPEAVQGQYKDNLNWTGVDEALEIAAEEEKYVLIDVYAEWCPYCQRMQSEVYPDDLIEETINRYFIPVRINTESSDIVSYLGNEFSEADFATALQNRGVPTIYFMNTDGEVVGQQPGFLDVDIFSKLLEFVGSEAYKHHSFEEFENQ